MDLRKEIRLGRTEMSTRELGRVEVVTRIRSKQLRMGGCEPANGGELSTGEAVVEALSGRRSGRSEAQEGARTTQKYSLPSKIVQELLPISQAGEA